MGNDKQNPEIPGTPDDSEALTEEEAKFLGDEDDRDTLRDGETLDGPDADAIVLPSGRAMQRNEAAALASERRHKIVVFAGAPDSGKTSLIADIYVTMQLGELDGISFGGSETLIGFETKCWSARASALQIVPETRRTSRNEPPYLQLSLSNAQGLQDLFICDISGEAFEDAANSNDACRKIVDLGWVDHFVLVIDGKKLSMISEREAVLTQAKQVLFRLFDSGVLPKGAKLAIAISKADELDLRDATTSGFIERLRKEFETKLRERDLRADFFLTSAHKLYGNPSEPFDLKKLVSYWMNVRPVLRSHIAVSDDCANNREIDRFGRLASEQ